MSTGLIEIMKRSAMDAVENGKPCDLRYGTVVSTSPLKIKVTSQLTLPEAMLIVPEHLTDYEVEVTIEPSYDWVTQERAGGSGDATYESHDHDIHIDKKKIKVHGALKVDDKVVLIRQAGGQYYLVLDRLVK